MAARNKPHVLIAGAGIGGLTLAQCLRARNHPFTIFERDRSASARSQGWAIAIHTVLADLMANIPEDMPSIENVSHLLPYTDLPPQMCFYDLQSGKVPEARFMVESKSKAEVGYGKGRVIRANRDRLRDWLGTNIDIQWGKQIKSFSQDENGVTVTFSDGSTATGDILVGAEGVRSAVRDGLALDARLQDVPVPFITGELILDREQHEKQMKLAHSAYAILGPDFQMFVGLSRVAENKSSAEYYWDLMWYDEARIGKAHWIDTASSKELHDYSLKRTSSIDQRFTEIIRLTRSDGMKTPPMILRDLALEEMPVSKVTLLGDAAHAMVPFKGEGGCHAIDDAIKLSKVLTTGGSLEDYQKEMLQRGSKAMKASRAAGAKDGTQDTDDRIAWGQNVQLAPIAA